MFFNCILYIVNVLFTAYYVHFIILIVLCILLMGFSRYYMFIFLEIYTIIMSKCTLYHCQFIFQIDFQIMFFNIMSALLKSLIIECCGYFRNVFFIN